MDPTKDEMFDWLNRVTADLESYPEGSDYRWCLKLFNVGFRPRKVDYFFGDTLEEVIMKAMAS